ncbi:hypothetical protein AVEN_121817-1 [Araneus ventricosus]|uniref:Uncharacterized protein n=1 Tax=Araneus ventricosus TaxID=182803 RepID=A0A4Y2PZG3_ARAVE|nr:hypothetical protein AVEN_121817-1 [Araneus ventricosus]
MTSSQQTCFASGLVDYALLLSRKIAAKLPHQVCNDKLISRKVKLAASVHAIWELDRFESQIIWGKSPCSKGSGKKSPKINGWCALLHDIHIGPFFFAETSVTVNLDMLQIYAVHQMQHLKPIDIFQQEAGTRMFQHFAGTGLLAGYPQGY